MNIGILSTARINDMILQAASRIEGVEVCSIASRDAGRASKYASSHNIPQNFSNYEDLFVACQ